MPTDRSQAQAVPMRYDKGVKPGYRGKWLRVSRQRRVCSCGIVFRAGDRAYSAPDGVLYCRGCARG